MTDFEKFARDHHVSSHLLNDYEKKTNSMFIEPTVIEERTSNMVQLSVFSRLFMDRILFLGTEINSDVANIINSQILFLAMEDPKKPISIYINSPGGSCVDGLSIYDVFKYVSCPIHTTCMGMSASMGAVLLSSGEKGGRSALNHGKVMIHEPIGGVYGKATDFEISYQEIMKYKETLSRILAENTGKSYEEIVEACKIDKWFTAQEAMDFGLIDNINQ